MELFPATGSQQPDAAGRAAAGPDAPAGEELHCPFPVSAGQYLGVLGKLIKLLNFTLLLRRDYWARAEKNQSLVHHRQSAGSS